MSLVNLQKGQLRDLIKEDTSPPPKARIRARNDIEAIERWLDEYFDKPTTFRAYKKEAERFLVWCTLERKTNFRALDREDVEAYVGFLKNPQPKDVWCGPKGGRQKDAQKAWYPFSGPLGQSALNTALAVLNSLMNYLLLAHYVEANPFALVRKKPRLKDKLSSLNITVSERILNDREWAAILLALEEMPEHNEDLKNRKLRLSFLIHILYFLGLRIDELAQAKWANFRKVNNRWWFFVCGKGDRLGKIPVNQQLLNKVITFRHALGLSPFPGEDEESAIIPSLSNKSQGLCVRQMSNLIKELAKKASLKFSDEPLVRQKILKFSAHWLRHLSASRQDLAGISFTNIKQNMRHQNEQTTRLYVHAYDEERHKEMEKLTL